MKAPRHCLLTWLLVTFSSSLQGFSAYENYLRSGEETHAGLIVRLAPEGGRAALAEAWKALSREETRSRFDAAGIGQPRAFTREIEGEDYAVVSFSFDGAHDYLSAAEAFEEATAEIDWDHFSEAHPRAAHYGRHWLQMEWINYIRGRERAGPPRDMMMIATRIKPEKEAAYRTLHQTVWPGVVDQVKRGNGRNLCIFLVELEGQLVEFLYLEYVGEDAEGDEAANQADPINQRWWKLTDACQEAFSDVSEGIWAPLEPVAE